MKFETTINNELKANEELNSFDEIKNFFFTNKISYDDKKHEFN